LLVMPWLKLLQTGHIKATNIVRSPGTPRALFLEIIWRSEGITILNYWLSVQLPNNSLLRPQVRRYHPSQFNPIHGLRTKFPTPATAGGILAMADFSITNLQQQTLFRQSLMTKPHSLTKLTFFKYCHVFIAPGNNKRGFSGFNEGVYLNYCRDYTQQV
jgi:hypothetical protein